MEFGRVIGRFSRTNAHVAQEPVEVVMTDEEKRQARIEAARVWIGEPNPRPVDTVTPAQERAMTLIEVKTAATRREEIRTFGYGERH